MSMNVKMEHSDVSICAIIPLEVFIAAVMLDMFCNLIRLLAKVICCLLNATRNALENYLASGRLSHCRAYCCFDHTANRRCTSA